MIRGFTASGSTTFPPAAKAAGATHVRVGANGPWIWAIVVAGLTPFIVVPQTQSPQGALEVATRWQGVPLQLGNEPNGHATASPMPAKDYADWLRESVRLIRMRFPHRRLVAAAAAPRQATNDPHATAAEYTGEVFAHGIPAGVRAAVHVYPMKGSPPPVKEARRAVRLVRQASGRSVWVAECGLSVVSYPNKRPAKTERMVRALCDAPGVQAVFYYTLGHNPNYPFDIKHQTAVLNADGTKTNLYGAVRRGWA